MVTRVMYATPQKLVADEINLHFLCLLKEAKTTTDAIRLLLDTVVSKSDKTYEAFLAILTEMRMEFVRDELEKAEVALAKEPPEGRLFFHYQTEPCFNKPEKVS